MPEFRQINHPVAKGASHRPDAACGGFFNILAVLLLWVTTVGTVTAHPILVPRPTQTLADRLLQSDLVVLAREDPQRPFHYATVKVIKGDLDNAIIDLFMPSAVRRQLASNPDLAVVLGRRAQNGKWQSLGFTSEDYMRVVNRTLDFAEEWTPNETNNVQRLQEFAKLLGHQDGRLHELAYLEIGRASYASIRIVGTDVPLEKVRSMHSNPLYFQWRGLDIMLLGLSGEKRDHTRVIEVMEDRQRLSSDLNLAAWATAYVEIRGTNGIDQLTQWYFRDSRRSRDELRPITRALAGHANEAPELRQPVVAAYSVMLETHPSAAPDIAHDLIAWQRWDLSEQFQQLQPQLARLDPLGVYKVNLYLQRARMHSSVK